jgi:protease IV
MKRSRTGIAILFIFFLVLGFVFVVVVLSSLDDSQENGSSFADLFRSDNKIGIITIEDTIISSDEILKLLRSYRRRSSIKAVLLRINSPGGTVAPAQEIYREIEKVKKKKPVVVSMETVGASAAYLIASNASRIVCSEGTITGSIGVIMMLPDIHKAINKIGVDVNVIKAGKFKDIGTGVRPLTDEEKNLLESFAAQVHRQFIDAVAKGRKGKIDRKKLESIADGSFMTGERAKELGLVDTLGNFYDAVDIAKKLGGIEGKPELVYPEEKWGGFMDLLMESSTKAVLKAWEQIRLRSMRPSVS